MSGVVKEEEVTTRKQYVCIYLLQEAGGPGNDVMMVVSLCVLRLFNKVRGKWRRAWVSEVMFVCGPPILLWIQRAQFPPTHPPPPVVQLAGWQPAVRPLVHMCHCHKSAAPMTD